MAAKITDIITLKKQLKENDIKQVYVFFGEEQYLIDEYIKRICEAVPDGGLPEFNRLVIEDIKTTLADISDFIETYPMMSEKKVLVIRNTGLLKSATEEAKSFWTKQLGDVPEHLVIIFAEREIDKRGVIYKAASGIGVSVEFSHLSATDLATWVQRQVLSAKKKIDKSNAEYLVEICGDSLGNLKNELDKLFGYCDEEVTKSDIDRLVTKSLNIRVFEMTDAIIEKDADKALSILYDMKTVKESAFKILYILFSTFDKLLQTELLLKEGETKDIIAKKLKVPPFIAKKYMKKTFGEEFLADCVAEIAEIDFAIKEGRTDEWTALEQFVAKLFKNR